MTLVIRTQLTEANIQNEDEREKKIKIKFSDIENETERREEKKIAHKTISLNVTVVTFMSL